MDIVKQNALVDIGLDAVTIARISAMPLIEQGRLVKDVLLFVVQSAVARIESLTAERDALREALVDVKGWIDNWSPPFVEDDEWPSTAARVKHALASEPRP